MVEGKKAWMLRDQVAQMHDLPEPTGVRLLPNFDPYVLGFYRHIPHVLDAAHKASIYRAAGWVSPVVLVNGRIEGVWQYERQRAQIQVRIEMFQPARADSSGPDRGGGGPGGGLPRRAGRAGISRPWRAVVSGERRGAAG